jgi:outer membrane protein assembly factor BamB
MRRFLILVSVLILTASSAAYLPGSASASPSPGGDWKQFGFDSSHSSFNPSETTLTAATVGSVHLLWSKGPAEPDVIEHGHVISCLVKCYSRIATTGGLYRTYTVYKRTGPIAVANGLLLTEGSPEPVFYGVPLSEAHGGWAQFFFNYQIGGPVYHAGRVFSADNHGFPHGHVNALDATNGARVWSSSPKTTEGFTGLPTVAFNRVYVPGPTSLQVFREDNGRFAWIVPSFNPSQVVAGAGAIYVRSDLGTTAYDPVTGHALWRSRLNGQMSADSTTLYISDGTSLWALDAATGATRWGAASNGTFDQSSVAGGLLWFVLGGSLHASDKASGHVVWASEVGPYFGQPLVGDGVVAIGCISPAGSAGTCVFGL